MASIAASSEGITSHGVNSCLERGNNVTWRPVGQNMPSDCMGGLALMVRLFILATHISRRVLPVDVQPPTFLRRPIWRRYYSWVRRVLLSKDVVGFLNQGYLGDANQLIGIDPDDVADHVSALLYEQVVSGIDFTDSKVIEVGCGPGAGSRHLASLHQSASFVGIDLNSDLIEWCREHNHLGNLAFRQGDAQKLPIDDGSVDAVVNVESSHCYPSRLRFLEEVVRVLRPGGAFLFADLTFTGRKGHEAEVISAQLQEAGLVIDSCIDITPSVLAARDAVSNSSFRARLREKMSALTAAMVEEGYCLNGTTFYSEMASGRVRFTQWRAFKPIEDQPVGERR
jgi:ubiquinone/menaquinone biosynthesis C-methylase UbiE